MKRTATYHALDLGDGRFMSLQTKADVDREVFRQAGSAVGWARTPSLPAGTLEHFCIKVDNVDLQRMLAALKEDGREGFVFGDNLFTSDPDGILVQVVDSTQRFAHEG
jgi:catechol 2,3-dioxygenase-like lactoylglutathione lyase family enzyme